MLLRNEPNPGREVTSRSEGPGVSNTRDQSGRQYRTDPRNVMKALARLVVPVPGHDHPIKLQDLLLEAEQLSAERGKARAGNVHVHKGDFERAIADFGQSIEIYSGSGLNPRYAEAYVLRGDARRRKGDYSGALADFGKAAEVEANDGEGYRVRGSALVRKVEYERAIAAFSRGIEVDPNKAAAYT